MNNEYYDYEDRRYVNPLVSRDEQLAFANNLRAVADKDISKIYRDTHALGTDVTPNLGGLNGATNLWKRNYVSPKVESMTQGLRAVAQSAALEGAMSNYLNQMKQKYNNAYKAAAKRSSGSGGSGYTTGGSDSDIDALLRWLAQEGYTVDEEERSLYDEWKTPWIDASNAMKEGLSAIKDNIDSAMAARYGGR